MYCSAVVLATVCIVVVRGDLNCTKSGGCGRAACGPLEVPVKGKPEQDSFCRPLFTPTWQRQKLRTCLCKRGYLRNSWGDCIPRIKCFPCKFRWQRDYRTCMPACPATCERPFGSPCNKPCTAGCDCPPGYVVNPKFPGMCMQMSNCHPKCPANSSFQSCVPNCLPKCGQSPPKACDIKCDSKGACVCNKGYAELERDGKKTCILQKMCPLLTSNKTQRTGGENRPTETPNMPGRVSGQPVVAASPVSTQNTSAGAGASVQGAQPSGAPGAGGLAVAVDAGGALPPATTGTGNNLISLATEAGKRQLVSTNGTSTLFRPPSGSPGTSGAGGLAVTVGAGGTLPPATSGKGGYLINSVTEPAKSELVSTNGTSTFSGPSSGSARTPGAGGLADAGGSGGTLPPVTSEIGGNLVNSTTEPGKSELLSTNGTSTLRGPSNDSAGTPEAGGLAVTVGAGGTLPPATSGTGGNLMKSATEAGRSELVSTNLTSTLSGPSRGAAGTRGAGGLADAGGSGGTLPPVTSETGGNLINSTTEPGKSELLSTNGTSTLMGPSSGSAGTPEAGGLAVTIGAGGILPPATSGTGGNLMKSATEAGRSELVSTNGTSTLSGPLSGAAGTPGAGRLAVTVVAEGTLPPATSGGDGSVIFPATQPGGRELVLDHLTNAHGGLSGGASETPEGVVDATPTASPAPALPVPVGSPPRSELPDTRHADLSAATSTARGAASFLSGPLHTSSPTPIRYSGASLGYSSWFPQTFSPPNYGLASFDFNPWATP